MILLQDYSFQCKCEACSKNFPLFHNLKSNDRKLLKIARKERSESFQLDSKTAERKFLQISNQIQNLIFKNQNPKPEVILYQECLQQYLAIIAKPQILIN